MNPTEKMKLHRSILKVKALTISVKNPFREILRYIKRYLLNCICLCLFSLNGPEPNFVFLSGSLYIYIYIHFVVMKCEMLLAFTK